MPRTSFLPVSKITQNHQPRMQILNDILTPNEAHAKNLVPLTTGYRNDEHGMLSAVLADLRRGGIQHGVVRADDGFLEVWRDRSGLCKGTPHF